MTLPLEGKNDADAALAHRASAFPDVSREQAKAGENERIVVECSLKQAGGLRDELFDTWAAVWMRPWACLRLDGELISLTALKRVLAVLDCAEAHAAQGICQGRLPAYTRRLALGCLHLHDIAPDTILRKGQTAELKKALAEPLRKDAWTLPIFPVFRGGEGRGGIRRIPAGIAKRAENGPEHLRDEHALRTMPHGGAPVGAGIAPATYADIGG